MSNGLGKPELRYPDSTSILTAAEFRYLKEHTEEIKNYSSEIENEYLKTVAWEKRSDAAKRAVATRRRNKTVRQVTK